LVLAVPELRHLYQEHQLIMQAAAAAAMVQAVQAVRGVLAGVVLAVGEQLTARLARLI
jgi:hypothetical protein